MTYSRPALLSVALAVAAGCAAAPPANVTRVAKERVAMLGESTCAGCHPDAAAEWAGSMHRASFTSSEFQQSYAAEKRDYCVSCHAPSPDRTAGIGCTACHEASEQHALHDRAHAMATTRACASCHDFDVPGTRTALQATEREHRASAFAGVACESCHMPVRAPGGARRHDHRFDVTRNPARLAAAIDVREARIRDAVVLVALASRGVGHRFPTGDLFRRLVVTVTAHDGEDLVGAETFYLRRDVDVHRASVRAKAPEPAESDTRLDGTPRELAVTFVRTPTRVHVLIEYERGAGGSGDALESFDRFAIWDADVPLSRAP